MLPVLMLFAPVALMAQDEPDLRTEERLHRTYQQFNQNPTPQDKWQGALSQASSQNYRIQSGDTLWDISETYFGDPEFWPKLWSLNKEEIFNPHEISPGGTVQFTPGTLSEAPQMKALAPGEEAAPPVPMSLAGASDDPDEPDEKPIVRTKKEEPAQMADVDLSQLKVPAPRKKTSKAAANPPGSLPDWKMRGDPDSRVTMDVTSVQRSPASATWQILSYVTEEAESSIGSVAEAEAGMPFAHENQYVVVKASGAASGQRYLVIHEVGTLKSPGGRSGLIYQIEGEVEVRESVNSSEGLFRAIVTKAYAPVQVGAQLYAGSVQTVSLQAAAAPSDAAARVIGGPGSASRELFGTGEILFLDGGSSGGLSPGQTLSVYRQEPVRNSATKQFENPRLIGRVQVVRVSAAFATAVVINAVEEIRVGDSTTRFRGDK